MVLKPQLKENRIAENFETNLKLVSLALSLLPIPNAQL